MHQITCTQFACDSGGDVHRRGEVSGRKHDVFPSFLAPTLQQMCPVMSWLLCLCLWVSVSAIQLCQATFYDTIQQHPGLRPGRTTVHMIGEPPPAVCGHRKGSSSAVSFHFRLSDIFTLFTCSCTGSRLISRPFVQRP